MRNWSNRCLWIGVALSTALVCATTSHATDAASSVLVLMDSAAESELTLIGLEEELGVELALDVRWVTPATSIADVLKMLHELAPPSVVLKGDRAIGIYQGALAVWSGAKPPAAVVIGGSHHGGNGQQVPNAVMLSDHVAGITSFVSLRAITKAPIRRVGVIYREGAEDFIRNQGALALQEKIELVGRSVGTEHTDRDLSHALRELLSEDTIDALWVLDDDALVSAAQVEKIWLPSLREHAKPVVVNSPKLVAPQVRFGMFAVLPDHVALGARAAEQVLDLQADAWRVPSGEVATAVSVRKVLLLSIHDDHLALRAGVHRHMDQVIE